MKAKWIYIDTEDAQQIVAWLYDLQGWHEEFARTDGDEAEIRAVERIIAKLEKKINMELMDNERRDRKNKSGAGRPKRVSPI